jgi:hypothetical protein
MSGSCHVQHARSRWIPAALRVRMGSPPSGLRVGSAGTWLRPVSTYSGRSRIDMREYDILRSPRHRALNSGAVDRIDAKQLSHRSRPDRVAGDIVAFQKSKRPLPFRTARKNARHRSPRRLSSSCGHGDEAIGPTLISESCGAKRFRCPRGSRTPLLSRSCPYEHAVRRRNSEATRRISRS